MLLISMLFPITLNRPDEAELRGDDWRGGLKNYEAHH